MTATVTSEAASLPSLLKTRAFPQAEDEGIETLARLIGKARELAPGKEVTLLDLTGVPVDTALIVITGEIEIHWPNNGRSNSFMLAYLKGGDVIEAPAFHGHLQASVRPMAASIVATAQLSLMANAMTRHPRLAAVLWLNAAAARSKLMERLLFAQTTDIKMRVLYELHVAAQEHPGSGARIARINQTRLAERVGSCRETVNRALKELMGEGRVIKTAPRTYRLR